jgi:hypothetical protein
LKDDGSDEEMNQIKRDGFYNEELERLLIGEVKKRPSSPLDKYQVDKEKEEYQEQMYK